MPSLRHNLLAPDWGCRRGEGDRTGHYDFRVSCCIEQFVGPGNNEDQIASPVSSAALFGHSWFWPGMLVKRAPKPFIDKDGEALHPRWWEVFRIFCFDTLSPGIRFTTSGRDIIFRRARAYFSAGQGASFHARVRSFLTRWYLEDVNFHFTQGQVWQSCFSRWRHRAIGWAGLLCR